MRLRHVAAVLCAVVAASIMASGFLVAHTLQAQSARAQHKQPSTAVVTWSTSPVVKHWGSYFGAKQGNFDIETSPVTAILPGVVIEVGSSNSTEYALLGNGSLYAWGMGNAGQLGNGGTANSFSKPVRVQFPAGVRIASIPADAMPFDTGLAVDTHGRVWGWGANGGGELCLGNTRTYLTPVQLRFSDVTALAGASNHALYDTHGMVYACGQNVNGDLGIGSSGNTTTPVPVAGLARWSVTRLVASFANSGALLSDGKYVDWGYNGGGQLGDGRIGRQSDVPVVVRLPRRVTDIALGGSIWRNGQTLVILSDGSLWAWGNGMGFQLGNGKRELQPSPVRFYSPAGVTYVSLATGSTTSYAISASGGVYAWGVSHVGQLGDGRTLTAKKPVLVARGASSISSTANNVVMNTAAN
jgi:alpha-tubulin suppressor-like RCC1 family protein